MILITGASGQLGTAVAFEARSRSLEHICTDTDTLDILNKSALKAFFELKHPSTVIHCAAFTDVNGAESKAELCMKINAEGAANVAAECEKVGASMIYISSDYVFDGKSPDFYETDSPTCPLSTYGRSKLEGERLVKENCQKHFIVRTSWLFGGKKNFVTTMLALSKEKSVIKVVADQFGSPTYTVDLARLLIDMALSDKYGTYHATNEGYCSWYELAYEAILNAGNDCSVIPIKAEDYPSAAVRPLNSCLSKKCLDDNGFERLPCWRDAVKRYVLSL